MEKLIGGRYILPSHRDGKLVFAALRPVERFGGSTVISAERETNQRLKWY
jgi:hypothetical protein